MRISTATVPGGNGQERTMPTEMKAIRLHEFGGPEVLRYDTVPIPELKNGEILVRVHAVGLNPPTGICATGMNVNSFRPS